MCVMKIVYIQGKLRNVRIVFSYATRELSFVYVSTLCVKAVNLLAYAVSINHVICERFALQ